MNAKLRSLRQLLPTFVPGPTPKSATFSALKARHIAHRISNDIRYEPGLSFDLYQCKSCGGELQVMCGRRAVQCPKCQVIIPVPDEVWEPLEWEEFLRECGLEGIIARRESPDSQASTEVHYARTREAEDRAFLVLVVLVVAALLALIFSTT